jgi:ribosomal protein S18 acetylase RimI-like enzyme
MTESEILDSAGDDGTARSAMGTTTQVRPDPWLASLLGLDAYRVLAEGALVARRPDSDYSRLRVLCAQPVFLYTKISTEDQGASAFLEDLGFRLVDTNVTFETEGLPGIEAVGRCRVRFANGDDRAMVSEVAGRSFRYSRFHLDPKISKTTADRIKAAWAGNYFAGGRGDYMIVAEVGGEVAGFLQLLRSPDGILTIDLIAVAEEARGMSVASDMIAYAARECAGTRRFRVGTQVANIPSLRLYEKLGFRAVSSAYVFHHHGSSDT